MKTKYTFALLITSICAISTHEAQGFLPSPDVINPDSNTRMGKQGNTNQPPPVVTIDDQVDDIFKPAIEELQYIINRLRGVRNRASADSLVAMKFDYKMKPLGNSAWELKQLGERHNRMKDAYGKSTVEKSAQRYTSSVSNLQNQLSAEIQRIHVNNYYGSQWLHTEIKNILNPTDPTKLPPLDIDFNKLFNN